MVNAIVILILILIAIFAIRGTIKHMKGRKPMLRWRRSQRDQGKTKQVRETCDR